MSDEQHLFDMVKSRYGDRLSPEELEEVRKGVTALAEAPEALRAVKLDPGEEPLSVFTPTSISRQLPSGIAVSSVGD